MMLPISNENDGAYYFAIVCPSVRLSVRQAFCACHILRTLHARVLKFCIWVPNEKISDPYFFLVRHVCLVLCPFEKIRIKSCEQDTCNSKSIKAGFLKFDIVSGNDV